MNVNRDFYLNKLISKMHNNKIKILTGIRRCGKSYLLFNLFKEYLISPEFPTYLLKKYLNTYNIDV
nr:AAA family ATPase [Mycoplasmopsis felis]